jgi:hypothetical protein
MDRRISASLAARIDELGQLDAEIAAFTHKIDRAKILRKEILDWYADAAPDAALSANGLKFTVFITACGLRRKVKSIAELFKRLGREKFLDHCEMPLGELDKLFAKAEVAELVEEARTGPRQVKTAVKSEPWPAPHRKVAV